MSRSPLDGLTNVLDEFGWGPNDRGATRIAETVSEFIREHRARQADPRPDYEPQEYACDTLIVGDRMFFGVSRYIREAGVDAVVATAWNAQSYMLSSISHLAGLNCGLKNCIVYLGSTDMMERGARVSYKVDRTIGKLHSAVRTLRRNNPQCRIVICTLQAANLPSRTVGDSQQTNRQFGLSEQQRKICVFNSLLQNCDWEVHDLDLPFAKPYSKTVARRLLNVVRSPSSQR